MHGRSSLCNVAFCLRNIFLLFLVFYFNTTVSIWENILHIFKNTSSKYSVIFVLNHVSCYISPTLLFFIVINPSLLKTYCFSKLSHVNILLYLKKHSKILGAFAHSFLSTNKIK